MSKDKLPNQEDITLLSELRSEYNCFDGGEEPYYRALSNAIQALRADEGAELEGELISRKMLKEALQSEISNVPSPDSEQDYYVGVKQGLKLADAVIDNAPIVDTRGSEYFPYRTAFFNGVDAMKRQYEKSKGEWIITDIGFARCPFCNCERQYPENYCGYCGADLRSEDNV